LSLRQIFRVWWPLALSWLLMSAEPSALAAIVARMAHPDINLAAYGSVSFAINGLIQAPLLSLLSLSTSLSRDWQSYQVGKRLMTFMGIGVTILYVLVAFTPLFDVVVKYLIGAPAEIIEPARISLMVGIPWSFAVGYRRFHQGVLIRFNHSNVVTMGTFTRFMADSLVLTAGYLTAAVPGAVLATLMMVAGVCTDGLFVRHWVKPVLQAEVRTSPSTDRPVQMKEMIAIYFPLALTPLLNQLVRPLGSAALSRLPDPITALAIWPVISSFSGLLLTPAAALNETVNALIDRPGAHRSLVRFITIVALIETAFMILIAATPLSHVWFGGISGLGSSSVDIASSAFWMLVPTGVLVPVGVWYTGAILNSRKTRAITEGMGVYLAGFVLTLAVASALVKVNGLYIVTTASLIASIAQTAWLGVRSRRARAAVAGTMTYPPGPLP
jgi:hypothetical protein